MSPAAAGRGTTILGAASSIGIRPYDEGGGPRHLDRAPGVLRELRVVERLGAADLGDVTPGAYRDFTRPPRGVRNEEALVSYNRALGERVARGLDAERFVLVLGGDCSIVLGSLLGATARTARTGLVYIDGHADFATPEESLTGSAASMCLALAVGRGDSPLSRLAGSAPLVRPEDVALIGRRDAGQAGYGHAALAASGILDMPGDSTTGDAHAAAVALERVGRLDGFWIHVDADVLNPAEMPAVDSPEPGGPGVAELSALVKPLVGHPKALGLQITIYDPRLDPDRSCAKRLITFLETVFPDRGRS
jgi:arginase